MASAKEEAVLQELRTRHNIFSAWVGYHDQFSLRDWITVLDEPIGANGYVSWTDVYPYQPDNAGGNQHCAVLMEGGMDDIPCNASVPYFCKISLPQ